jgi:hypothetical protein
MLIIEQSDTMLRDLRNSKGGRELSAMPMEILVSGVKHVSNLVFSLFMSEYLAKVLDRKCHYFIAHPSHTSCSSNNYL